ncbi:hypothetical protein RQP46_010083 [Phenoliferia psychrophenolica]
MKLPSAPGIAFGLSHLLGEKMRLAHMLSSPSSSSLEIPAPSAYLATRCPPSLAPQLDQDDVCSCGSPSSGLPLCPAAPDDFPNHYSTAICLEDLRDGKRSPTCGIEFHDRVSEDANPVGGIGGGSGASGTTGGDPDRVDTVETRKCPEGFLKILTGPENFICQDSASPHSVLMCMEADDPAVDVAARPSSTPPGISAGQDSSTILRGKKLAVVFTAMLLSVLLIALDQTIFAAFFLIFGQVLRIYPVTLLEDRPKLFGPLIGGALHQWIGGTLVLAAVTMLVLALDWGGVTKPWDDAAVIVTFVLCGVLSASIVFWQRYLRDQALVPIAIFKSVSVFAIILFGFCERVCHLIFTYWVPIYYQAGREHSAEKSGIDLLPFMLSVVVSVIISGQVTAKTGHYRPWLVAGPNFIAVGAGLMYTVNEHTSASRVIGYQILAGGTIGLAVAETVFSSQLTNNLSKYSSHVDTSVIIIIKDAPVSIYTSIPKDLVPSVVKAYVKSIDTVVFIICLMRSPGHRSSNVADNFCCAGVPLSGISLGLAFLIKDIDVREKEADSVTQTKSDQVESSKAEVSPAASDEV